MNADDLAKILDELGQRLGPTGEYVVQLAVRQVYVEAIVTIVATALLAVAGLVVGPRIYRWYEADEPYGIREMPTLVVGLLFPIAMLVGITGTLIAIPRLLNPEYAALRDIIGAIR